MLQPTTGDMYYDDGWQYATPYALLVQGSVVPAGGKIATAYAQKEPKGTPLTVKEVPETEAGIAWYAVSYDAEAQKALPSTSANPSTGGFLYWPTAYRTTSSIVPVPTDRFRLLFTKANPGVIAPNQRSLLQPYLDALVSIYLPRIRPFVTAAAPGLDASGNERAQLAVTHTLAQAVFTIWYDFLLSVKPEAIADQASKGIVPTSASTIATPDRRSGGWDTLGVMRAEADTIASKLQQEPKGGLAQILGAIAREPATAGKLFRGRTPGDVVKALGVFGLQDLDRVAQLADRTWAEAAPTSPASAQTPSAQAPSTQAPSTQAPSAQTAPPVTGRGTGDTNWLPIVAAALGGFAVVALLLRSERRG